VATGPTPVPPPASPPDLESFGVALDAGQIGVWSWDLRSNRLTWSTKLEDFHGRPEETHDGTLSIVPQDIPSQTPAASLPAIQKALQTHEACRLEYRARPRAGNEERWLEAIGHRHRPGWRRDTTARHVPRHHRTAAPGGARPTSQIDLP
jgi:PAS domain-containing protein